MLKKLLNLALILGIWQTADAQLAGVNTNFDSHYTFSNNFNRTEGGTGTNGGLVNFVADRNAAGNSAIQVTNENGVIINANNNRAYTDAGFSFAAWINPTNFSMLPGICTGVGTFNNTFDTRMIVEAANTVSPFEKDFSLYLKNGKVSYDINTTIGLVSHTFTNGTSPSLNSWQHIAIALVSANIPNVGLGKKVIYYLNGAAQDSLTYDTNFNVVFSGKAMEFGATNIKGSANCGNTFDAFQGSLDEFTFLSRGLTSVEMKDLYNNERVYTNAEISSLLNNQLAYYPINNDFQDYANPSQVTYNIQKIVPTTYNSQALDSNRDGVANSSITQGAINASASLNFNGYRIPDGNKFIKSDSLLTIALWLKNTGTTWNDIDLIDASNGNVENFKLLFSNTGKVFLRLGASVITFLKPLNIPLNSWNHLAISVDGKNKNAKLYLNGEEVDSYTSSLKFKIPNNNTGDIFLMTSAMYYQNGFWQGGGNGLVGNMDEIRFFNNALTGIEIKKILSPTGKLSQKVTSKTIVYGTPTGSILSGILGGSTTSNTYTIANSNIAQVDVNNNGIKGIKAGSTTIRVQNTGDANYLAIDTTVSLTIAKRDLLYQIVNTTKSYGEENPIFNIVLSNQNANTGFVNNDTEANATNGVAKFISTATTSSPIGTYPVSYQNGSLTSDNYNFVVTNGSLNIIKNTPVVTLINDTIIYGDTIQLVSAKVGVLDVPVSISGDANYLNIISGTTNVVGMSIGATSISYNVIGTSNYNNLNSGFGNIKIVKAPLTLVINNQSIQIGEAVNSYFDIFNTNNPYQITGLKNGEEYYNGLLGNIELTALNYDQDTSLRTSYTLTYVKPDPSNVVDGSNYYINNVVDGTLYVTGKRSQSISFEIACNESKRESKGGPIACNQCPTVFPIKKTTDAPYSIQGVVCNNLSTGNKNNQQVQFQIVSGPATILGNTITLTGDTGTVTVNMYQDGNSNYESIAKGNTDYTYCFKVTSDSQTAIDESLNFDINIYPNPVKDVLFVNDKAEIINLLGEKVLEGNHQIDVSNLTNGIYLVKIKNTITKIIKE